MCIRDRADSEEENFHRPLSDEQLFFHAVRSGDIDFVRENCKQKKFAETEGVGTLSRDPVTNLKYHFVVTTAFVTSPEYPAPYRDNRIRSGVHSR